MTEFTDEDMAQLAHLLQKDRKLKESNSEVSDFEDTNEGPENNEEPEKEIVLNTPKNTLITPAGQVIDLDSLDENIQKAINQIDLVAQKPEPAHIQYYAGLTKLNLTFLVRPNYSGFHPTTTNENHPSNSEQGQDSFSETIPVFLGNPLGTLKMPGTDTKVIGYVRKYLKPAVEAFSALNKTLAEIVTLGYDQDVANKANEVMSTVLLEKFPQVNTLLRNLLIHESYFNAEGSVNINQSKANLLFAADVGIVSKLTKKDFVKLDKRSQEFSKGAIQINYSLVVPLDYYLDNLELFKDMHEYATVAHNSSDSVKDIIGVSKAERRRLLGGPTKDEATPHIIFQFHAPVV